MIELLFVILGIVLILFVLVILLVDALVNDSDAVTNAPGTGMRPVDRVNPGERAHLEAAPLQSQPVEKAAWVKLPKPVPHVFTQQEAEQRLARMMSDPELRNIPPMLFTPPIQEHPNGERQIVLFPPPPVPLLLPGVGEGNIVEQINKILQIRVAGTPLAQRDVRLIESPARGVVVKVGPLSFDGVDAVTDPEVKAAVQAAVAEWEATQ